ncbi:MAG TPA: hypothetical protein VJX23_11735 [Candidatus Binataceae bacterium]|nr:hypothetical protein [Candidatus Binataceae bacterium]
MRTGSHRDARTAVKMFASAVSATLVVLAAAVGAPALAHDMSAMGAGAMGSMDGAPNGMGSQMHMDAHMRMTALRPQTPQDIARSQDILATLRRALRPYRNYRVALAEGYHIFLPTVPQPVYHFSDYAAAMQEYQGHFDPARPGSLLYVKKPDGDYVLVGAMYSAPPDFTPDQLNDLVPLSVAQWHEHVNICLPVGITLDDLLRGNVGAGRTDLPGMIAAAANPDALEIDRNLGVLADGRFGFHGKIADATTCEADGGHFLPLAFGWMVHVYPFAGDDLKVAYGLSVPKPPEN